MELVTNYLSEQFDSGKEYRTLSGYRSAISAYHKGQDGVKMGRHPLIQELLTAFFNRRPPKPRYDFTWDVDKVLREIKSWGPTANLGLKDLSLKLTILMALCSASRASELANLNVEFMQDTGKEITFGLPGLTKTRKVGQKAHRISFAEYPEDPNLDVSICIRRYIARTETVRRHHNQLLISFQKPHNPIATCSVARWIKDVLAKSNIDTTVFKAHSTRGAATSKATNLGLSANQIMEKANWQHASTFRRFYYRECSDEFQKAVLS